MGTVASRELRNSTRSLLDRVATGETITITVDGRPAALLTPIARRSRWVARNEFASTILTSQADAELTAELTELAEEVTDEPP